MMDKDYSDVVARAAARILLEKRALTIREAIAAALAERAGRTGVGPGAEVGAPVEASRVRRHLQAMTMQQLGREGYEERVKGMLAVIEQLMTMFTEMLEGVEPLLVGRAAKGLLDGPAPMHIRLYTDRTVEEMAALVVEHGYEEPTFTTAHTRRGALNRICFSEEGIEFILTRIPDAQRETSADRNRDLFTGKPVVTLTVDELRRRLEPQPGSSAPI